MDIAYKLIYTVGIFFVMMTPGVILKKTKLAPDGLGKGYALATLHGCPLGWVKCADGQLKNHYPKGLRR